MKSLPVKDLDFLAKQTRLILSSYRHWTGKSLWPENKTDEILAREVFFAPFVIASAGTEPDPILNYGNQKALDLWEMDWDTFTRTPGKQTAEPVERGERAKFLETVKKQGYIQDYRGIRITSTGRRFEIQNATVWNLIDEKGRYAGQAVTFTEVKRVS
ncbi:MAG: MEKHLA domain-containing protein [Candidatus Omnitrophica bacterium]|nr:MEKHLA domain-containing protein [Candidatus Omnitrophota bacterium]